MDVWFRLVRPAELGMSDTKMGDTKEIPLRIKLMFWRHLLFTSADQVRVELRALSSTDWELLDAYANRWRI